MSYSTYDSRIVLAEHLQERTPSLFVDLPILLYQLIEGPFDGIPTAGEFSTTGGTLVLLLLDYVP